ncbi:MAG TPA: hypothetical protein VH117_01545 [Edaphobacter sp.]|jgi:hypothetical protein|nr:hypothetical protein [Edaphobacter sp.]
MPEKKLRRFFIKDQNFLMQTRVNQHLLLCEPSSPMQRRLDMNSPNARSPLPPLELPVSLLPMVPAATEGPSSSHTSECLYQIAALTAGAIFLATLL